MSQHQMDRITGVARLLDLDYSNAERLIGLLTPPPPPPHTHTVCLACAGYPSFEHRCP